MWNAECNTWLKALVNCNSTQKSCTKVDQTEASLEKISTYILFLMLRLYIMIFTVANADVLRKIEKILRDIQGEKSGKDTASSGNCSQQLEHKQVTERHGTICQEG